MSRAERKRNRGNAPTLLALRVGEGLLAASFLTLLLYSHVNFATAGFLQLLIVLIVATRGGFWAATCVSLFANVCLNYFFIPPLYGFSVSDPQNWIALFAFEGVALLTSRISAKAQEQAIKALRSRREMEQLYQVSSKLLVVAREPSQPTQIALILRDVFGATAVALFDLRENRATSVGTGDPLLDSEVRGAGMLNEDIQSSSPDTVIRVLYLGGQALGAMGLRGCHMTPLLADALASLVAIGLERGRDLTRERTVEVELRVERLRAQLLSIKAN